MPVKDHVPKVGAFLVRHHPGDRKEAAAKGEVFEPWRLKTCAPIRCPSLDLPRALKCVVQDGHDVGLAASACSHEQDRTIPARLRYRVKRPLNVRCRIRHVQKFCRIASLRPTRILPIAQLYGSTAKVFALDFLSQFQGLHGFPFAPGQPRFRVSNLTRDCTTLVVCVVVAYCCLPTAWSS